MSTIEDFKNAPLGATATYKATGSRAMKIDDDERRWITPRGSYYSDEGMVKWGYTLEQPAPESAREALDTAREAFDLAWDLAHEVKPGQVIPKGTRFLEVSRSVVKEYIAHGDIKIIRPELASITRTFDPLPDPEPELPDWIDAPAVLAKSRNWTVPESQPQVFTRDHEAGLEWLYNGSEKPFHWSDLTDVTPLYPPNEGTLNGTEAPKGYTPSNSMGFKNEETEK